MISLLLAAAVAAPCAAATPAPGQPLLVPTHDVNDTFYATPLTATGIALWFYIDSGAEAFVFTDDAVKDDFIPESADSAAVFPPLDCHTPMPPAPSEGLQIAPESLAAQMPLGITGLAGVLGGPWLDGRTWTWDYPGHALYWRANGDVPKVDPAHVVQLGFQTKDGKHTTAFPRIAATIDGQTYQFLLDTGAHTRVVAAAAAATGFTSEPRAISFITKSIADGWHQLHPDWRYVQHAEMQSGATMIQVPTVQIGGYNSGPAWFVVRSDTNFTTYMSQWMDQPIVGSIGGDVLHAFKVTVDYAAEKAYFEQP